MALTSRPATRADVADVVDLQARWDTSWFGAPEHDDDDVRAEIGRVDPLTERSLLLHDGDLRLVGAAWWWRPDDPTLLIDPTAGIDAAGAGRDLVQWLDRSGADLLEVLWRDTTLLGVLAAEGWQHVRSQFELVRSASDLPAPEWPAGVTVSSLADDPEVIAEIHRLIYDDAGWADVPGHTVRGLAEWRGLFVTGEDLEQQVVVSESGRPVGVALGKVFPEGTGWVAQVAVRRDQQGRGMGSALLAEAFARRVAAGATQVGLGVSATNAGALRLYERLGLTVDREWMAHRATGGRSPGPLSASTSSQDRRRVLEALAVELSQLPHAVSDGLHVHVQLGGHGLPASLVQQPRQQGLLEALPGGRPEPAQRREHPGPQVVEGVGVRGHDQVREVVLGVQRSVLRRGGRHHRCGTSGPVVRRTDLCPRAGRADHRLPSGKHPGQVPPAGRVHVRHQEQ